MMGNATKRFYILTISIVYFIDQHVFEYYDNDQW